MENFFGLLKSELLYLQKFDSMEHFINQLHNYKILTCGLFFGEQYGIKKVRKRFQLYPSQL